MILFPLQDHLFLESHEGSIPKLAFYNPACSSLLLGEPLNDLKLTNVLVLQTETKGQEVKGVLLQEVQLMKDFL